MADTRGVSAQSRSSYISQTQSQLSESTIINQDITDQELFNLPEDGQKSSIQPNRQVKFAPSPLGADRVSQLGDQSKTGVFRNKRLDLMERLVARPEKAQVFQAMKGSVRTQPKENGTSEV